jgi:Gram-negative bacterial TonB protein C-terminal
VLVGILALSAGPCHAGVPQEEKKPLVYVRHLEPPLHYPGLARQAQLQGTVLIKVTIGADGNVLTAKSLTHDEDSRASAHPLLRDETEKLVKKWTFGCVNCSSDVPYETINRFTYQLTGEGILYDDTRVSMNLPDEVIITALPQVPCSATTVLRKRKPTNREGS